MNLKTMKEALESRSKQLTLELIQMEKEFNTKKEEYLKIQGALEALYELDKESSSNSTE